MLYMHHTFGLSHTNIWPLVENLSNQITKNRVISLKTINEWWQLAEARETTAQRPTLSQSVTPVREDADRGQISCLKNVKINRSLTEK